MPSKDTVIAVVTGIALGAFIVALAYIVGLALIPDATPDCFAVVCTLVGACRTHVRTTYSESWHHKGSAWPRAARGGPGDQRTHLAALPLWESPDGVEHTFVCSTPHADP